MTALTLALLELPARYARQSEALADAARLLEERPCDLALLPECALTGYVSPEGDFDLSPFAEPLGRSTQLEGLTELARRAGSVIAGPLVERDEGRLHNAFVVVTPDGQLLSTYRKRHPWFPETWATPGAEPHPVFTVAGITFSIAICFDIHFLAREGREALAASDVLLFPSAWVDDGPRDLRRGILGPLARAHDVVIANANWGVGDPRVRGQGRSRVVFPDGRVTMLDLESGGRRLDVLCSKKDRDPRRAASSGG